MRILIKIIFITHLVFFLYSCCGCPEDDFSTNYHRYNVAFSAKGKKRINKDLIDIFIIKENESLPVDPKDQTTIYLPSEESFYKEKEEINPLFCQQPLTWAQVNADTVNFKQVVGQFKTEILNYNKDPNLFMKLFSDKCKFDTCYSYDFTGYRKLVFNDLNIIELKDTLRKMVLGGEENILIEIGEIENNCPEPINLSHRINNGHDLRTLFPDVNNIDRFIGENIDDQYFLLVNRPGDYSFTMIQNPPLDNPCQYVLHIGFSNDTIIRRDFSANAEDTLNLKDEFKFDSYQNEYVIHDSLFYPAKPGLHWIIGRNAGDTTGYRFGIFSYFPNFKIISRTIDPCAQNQAIDLFSFLDTSWNIESFSLNGSAISSNFQIETPGSSHIEAYIDGDTALSFTINVRNFNLSDYLNPTITVTNCQNNVDLKSKHSNLANFQSVSFSGEHVNNNIFQVTNAMAGISYQLIAEYCGQQAEFNLIINDAYVYVIDSVLDLSIAEFPYRLKDNISNSRNIKTWFLNGNKLNSSSINLEDLSEQNIITATNPNCPGNRIEFRINMPKIEISLFDSANILVTSNSIEIAYLNNAQIDVTKTKKNGIPNFNSDCKDCKRDFEIMILEGMIQISKEICEFINDQKLGHGSYLRLKLTDNKNIISNTIKIQANEGCNCNDPSFINLIVN